MQDFTLFLSIYTLHRIKKKDHFTVALDSWTILTIINLNLYYYFLFKHLFPEAFLILRQTTQSFEDGYF